MTLIVGTYRDAGGVALASGVLRVQLDAPLVDLSTTPSSYDFAIARDYPIVNGAAGVQTGGSFTPGVNIPQSQTSNVSYTFTVLQNFTDFFYYKPNGEYFGVNENPPTNADATGNYYSGVSRTPESVLLQRVAKTRLETVGQSFQAIVPNLPQVEFSQLRPTGFATDRGPQTARQVGEYLKSDPLFLQSLINILVTQGTWDASILYRRGNLVLVGGSTYQCIADVSINNPPASSPNTWRLFAGKGEPGGTGGNDAVFGGAWDGDLNAPSKNAVYDEFVRRPTQAQVDAKAAIASPALTGSPTVPTQPVGTGTGTNRTTIANCEYADRADAALIQFPIGAIAIASSPNPPIRTVRANLQAISRTTFSTLFAIIGTTFGPGDGTTTFNVPNIAAPGPNLYYVIVTGV